MIYVSIKDMTEDSCEMEMRIEGDGRLLAHQLAAMLKQIEKTAPECLMHAIELVLERNDEE